MASKVTLKHVASRTDYVHVFLEIQDHNTQFIKELGYHSHSLTRNTQGERSFLGAYFWASTSPHQINRVSIKTNPIVGFVSSYIYFRDLRKYFCVSTDLF